MGSSFSRFLLVLIAASSIYAHAFGAPTVGDWFVSPEGQDSADGKTPATALRSVQTAVDRAKPGEVIAILPGWHEGGIKLKPGLPGKPIIIRAARPGWTFVGRSNPSLTGFLAVEGFQFTWSAPCDERPLVLLEVSTGISLRNLPAAVDVEHFAGSFSYDEAAKKVYVHPSDSESPQRHSYVARSSEGVGFALADHNTLDGLTLSGFGDSAFKGIEVVGVQILNCRAHDNGAAVFLEGATDTVIRNNEVWRNAHTYNETAMIYVGRKTARNVLIEGNRVWNGRNGIRYYAIEVVEDFMLRDNLIFDCVDGSFTKGKQDGLGKASKTFVGLKNVVVQSKDHDFWSTAGGHNTYSKSPRPTYIKATDLLIHDKDWLFADPAHYDYRLQSDSPARGAAPDGSDLGAHPYAGTVGYVRPDGDDSKEGTSVKAAWKTLKHAASKLKPGQTLYIAPGDWSEPLLIENLRSPADNPAKIRIHGRGVATFPSVKIQIAEHLSVEGIVAKGDPGSIEIAESSGVALVRCVVGNGSKQSDEKAGVIVSESSRITIDHCGISTSAGPAISLTKTAQVEIASSVLASATGPQIMLDEGSRDVISNFNGFMEGTKAVSTGDAAKSQSLQEWETASRNDGDSIEVTAATFVNLRGLDFTLLSGGKAGSAGRFSSPLGPSEVLLPPKVRPMFERIELVSATRTSANLTYWTPGRVTGMIIEWGKSPDYGQRMDRCAYDDGEYETFHTVSLLGLAPATKYHCRVGFRDQSPPPEKDQRDESAGDDDPQKSLVGNITWSEDFTFETASVDPQPSQWFVSTQGNDEQDGRSVATAWRTLHKAARQAGAGDTVTIAPGSYVEMLRPLQTGTSEDRRITFRAEKPMTVSIDAGFEARNNLSGRSHAAQIMNKAFVTLENLSFEGARQYDNGGYRGFLGYSSLVFLSNTSGIKLDSCFLDGRRRYMTGLISFACGDLAGVPEGTLGLVARDNLFLRTWYWAGIWGDGKALFENNAFVRGLLLGFVNRMRNGDGAIKLRNNIFQSLLPAKTLGSLLAGSPNWYDSDFNCFAWDATNKERVFTRTGNTSNPTYVRELAGWREHSKQDKNSIEAEPGYPLSAKTGFVLPFVKGDPRVEDLILPPESPLRKAGENGADIGPRWEKFLVK
jgi:hypothetical protein